MHYSYQYPRPAVTTDCIVFRPAGKSYELLLIRRGRSPFKGMWALPGGFMDMDETLDESAARELAEETSLQNVKLTQFRAYSAIDRDPRQRTIGIAFYGFVEENTHAEAGDDAADSEWFPLENIPEMAFDHSRIVGEAIEKLIF